MYKTAECSWFTVLTATLALRGDAQSERPWMETSGRARRSAARLTRRFGLTDDRGKQPTVRVDCCAAAVTQFSHSQIKVKFFLRGVSARLPAERFCSTKKRGDVAAAGPFCSGEWEGNVLFSGRDNVLTWQWLRRQPGLKDGSGLWQKRLPDVASSRTATITRSLRGLRSTTS